MSAANDMTDTDRYEELVVAAQRVIDDWPTNQLAPAVNQLRETLEMHGTITDPWEGPLAEVRFSYNVSVPEKWLVQGGPEGNEAQWRLAGGVAHDAYDLLMEGISDLKGDWFPRYEVLCLQDYMAGQICGLERGHEGDHR